MDLVRLIEARAHRALRRLANYCTTSDEVDDLPTYIEMLLLRDSEKVLGVYENTPQEQHESVVVTTLGLHIRTNGEWQVVDYTQIDHIQTPSEEIKHHVEELVAHLKSGQRVTIPIRGGRGRFRDAWPFLRFLNRVIADVQGKS